MASELPTILTPEPSAGGSIQDEEEKKGFPIKKFILILLTLIVVVGGIVFVVIKKLSSIPAPEQKAPEEVASSSPNLPDYNGPDEVVVSDLATTTDMKIEYISFSDYYVKPDNSIQAAFENYVLPINSKIDIINYHDVSRKLKIDQSLSNINNFGFAVIDNPWSADKKDFYSVYKALGDQQIPVFITSDFIIYYYQNILKKSFKDIEENIFYDNLWDINKAMYEAAKKRYETRLTSIGNVNDPLLEGARLETVFFAVSLELLKPMVGQVADSGVKVDSDKFTSTEASRFVFSAPDFLASDVAAEVKLIRAGKNAAKSPVFLYVRDYGDFNVPDDYKNNAKLNNFYLTSKWLNSVFPLYYRSDSCPGCLLDKEDWRVNMVAAVLISDDFSSLPQLKNRWARIYKVISFFKGLRDDLDYIDYRDSLRNIFGDDYNIEALFKGDNPEYQANLDKLAEKISSYDFLEIQGGPSASDVAAKVNIGFKMLAGSYSPDTYIFDRLTSPSVGGYSAGKAGGLNTTYCETRSGSKRCNGSYIDIINLVYPVLNDPYFTENASYERYGQESLALRRETAASVEKHSSNYWSTLSIAKNMLENNKATMPIFARSPEWEDRYFSLAAASWADLRLPFDKFSVKQSFEGRGLDDFSSWSEYSYVEPNIALINELLANNKMILDMLSTLQVSSEVKLAVQEIQNSTASLENIRRVIKKEISGEKLESVDYEDILGFANQLEIISPAKSKLTSWPLGNGNRPLKADLSNLKLIVVVNQRNGNKSFSVGPIWSYKESR